MIDSPAGLRRRHVQRRFDRAAGRFGRADFVHRHAEDGLIERLAAVRADAARVLDLGSGTGRSVPTLLRRFRGAFLIRLDLSRAMLLERRARPWSRRTGDIQADAGRLPLAGASVDVVVANLLLPWIDDLAACLGEIARVLRRDGLFAFSTLGPDSLLELRKAWAAVDELPHVNLFPDMHDVGDALLRAGLRDPVLDVDPLKLEYRDARTLMRDLRDAGAGNALAARRRTLTGKARFARMLAALGEGRGESPISLTLELIYGHAWGGEPREREGEYRIPAAAIGRRGR